LCADVPKPYSEDFKVPGLKTGRYEVYMISTNNCSNQTSACLESSKPVGAVEAVQLKTGAPQKQISQAQIPVVKINTGRLVITFSNKNLNGVHAALFNSAGIRVQNARLNVTETGTGEIELPSGIQRGMYFLRLSSNTQGIFNGKVVIGDE
jgi:hypothetical protein